MSVWTSATDAVVSLDLWVTSQSPFEASAERVLHSAKCLDAERLLFAYWLRSSVVSVLSSLITGSLALPSNFVIILLFVAS